MKTPIKYYGGKQTMIADILPLFPKDYKGYIEPFAGGAAIFFAKEPSKLEVLNDMNGELVNFYRICKTNIDALMEKVNASIYSLKLYEVANCIYSAPMLFDEVTRAWALWYLSRTSFASQLGIGFSRQKCTTKKDAASFSFYNSKPLLETACKRLEHCTIIECDAIDCIKDYNSKNIFYYIDPPYVGARQGHYTGYTQEDFNNLLETLTNIKGKFLLSSYNNEILVKYTQNYNWHTIHIDKINKTSFSTTTKKRKKCCEVLTYNYEN